MTGAPAPPVVVDSAPMTDAQRRAGGRAGPAAYVERVAVEISGPLEGDRLVDALRRLTVAQSALRSTLRPVAGTGDAVQVVLADAVSTRRIALDGHVDEAQVLAVTTGTPKRPTDLGLFEADLVGCGPNRHVLVVRVHHLFSDGWSYEVLLSSLSALYDDPAADVRPSRDYAAVCRDLVDRPDDTTPALSGWRRRLAGIEPDRPLVADRGSQTVYPDVHDDRFVVDAALAARIRQAGRNGRGGALAAPALTAVAMLLSAGTGRRDVRIATPIANRPDAARQQLVGFFANLALLRIDVDDASTVADLLAQVEQLLVEAQALQHLDFVAVLRDIVSSGGPPPRELYSTLVVVNTMRPRTLSLSGVDCRELDVALPSPRRAPTTLECRWQLDLRDDRVLGTLTTPTALFDIEQAAQLRRRFLAALDAVGDQPSRPVGELVAQLRG